MFSYIFRNEMYEYVEGILQILGENARRHGKQSLNRYKKIPPGVVPRWDDRFLLLEIKKRSYGDLLGFLSLRL